MGHNSSTAYKLKIDNVLVHLETQGIKAIEGKPTSSDIYTNDKWSISLEPQQLTAIQYWPSTKGKQIASFKFIDHKASTSTHEIESEDEIEIINVIIAQYSHIWTEDDFDEIIDIDEIRKPYNFQMANKNSEGLEESSISFPLLEEMQISNQDLFTYMQWMNNLESDSNYPTLKIDRLFMNDVESSSAPTTFP